MTVSDEVLAKLEAEVGSEISAYQPWLGIDVETGDWWDTTGKFEAADIEAMIAIDGRARAIEQVLTLPLRAAPFTVKAAKGDTGEAELVQAVLDGMVDTPLRQVVGQAAQSLIYRITYLEKCFTVTDDSQIGFKAIAWRPPDSCGLLRDRGTGRITGFTQDLYGSASPARIMGPKAAVFIHGATKDPVRGVTEMSVSYRCFRDKQKLRALWMLLLERLGAPWIVARTESGQENATASTLAKLRGGGVAAVSGVDGVDVLNVAGEVGHIFQQAVQFLDSEMAGSVLAGFLDLASAASRGAGSLALSQDQTDFYADSMDAAAREVAETFQKTIVTPIVQFNRGPKGVAPDVELGPISGATTQQLISMLQALAASPSGTILPAEFVDELTLRVAGILDFDVDKIRDAINSAQEKAASTPAASPSAPVHATVSTLTRAAEQPEDFQRRTVIGLAGGADPKVEVDLASIDGHHIPGTAYHWRHNWHPIDVYTALKHRLTGEARDLHRSGAAFHNEEPSFVGNAPRQVPHPSGHIHSDLGGGPPSPGAPGISDVPHRVAPVSASVRLTARGELGKKVQSGLDAIDTVHDEGGLNELPINPSRSKNEAGSYNRNLVSGDHIKVSALGPHPALTTAHEVGHWIDIRALASHDGMKPPAGSHRRGMGESAARTALSKLSGPDAGDVTPGWRAWAEAIKESDAVKNLAGLLQDPRKDPLASRNRGHLRYLLSAEELWARSYAQYIATRSGDQPMVDAVRTVVNGPHFTRDRQWHDGDFELIRAAIDEILEEQGWRH